MGAEMSADKPTLEDLARTMGDAIRLYQEAKVRMVLAVQSGAEFVDVYPLMQEADDARRLKIKSVSLFTQATLVDYLKMSEMVEASVRVDAIGFVSLEGFSSTVIPSTSIGTWKTLAMDSQEFEDAVDAAVRRLNNQSDETQEA